MDSTALRPVLLAESAAFVVITGLTINLTPSNVVIKTEKPPIVLFGTRRRYSCLPCDINTEQSIIRPFFNI